MGGSRGGNGIVIVTTKRGNTDGKTRFNFTANAGIQQVAKRLDLLNRDQYLDYLRESFTNGNRAIPAALQPGAPALPDTDWQKEIFTTGVQQQYQVSAAGGSLSASEWAKASLARLATSDCSYCRSRSSARRK